MLIKFFKHGQGSGEPPVNYLIAEQVLWEQDGEQYVTVISGWGGAVPLWGGEVAKKVEYLNQGGTLWTFRVPKELASAN